MGLIASGACGDDSGTVTPDAPKQIDAAVTPDTPNPPMFKGFDANEGGEVRMEYVRFANANASARVTAFLYRDSGSTDYFPFLNLNGCTDMRAKDKWPMATNPVTERVYDDPGMIIISGGTQPLGVPRRTAMFTDPFARQHPADEAFFHFGGSMAMDGTTYFSPQKSYDVTFTGSSEVPAQILDDAAYMPADFTLTTPDAAGFPASPILPVAIAAGTDQTFTWTTPAETPPTGVKVQSLVAFTGANGPAVVCVEDDDGSVTVPAAMIDIVRTAYPSGGTLARQKLTHQVRELVDSTGKTGRRIDLLAVWCYATSFTVP